MKRNKASSTQETYQRWKDSYQEFCRGCGYGEPPTAIELSAELVCEFLAGLHIAGRKPSTIVQARAGIKDLYETWGIWPSPTDHPSVVAYVAELPRISPRQMTPLNRAEVWKMAEACGSTFDGIHDRALLLLCAELGARRSEVTSLNVEDVEFTPSGCTIVIRKSKNDQQGYGRSITIERRGGPYCAVAALERWIHEADLVTGAIFRHIRKGGQIEDGLNPASINLLVKAIVTLIGYDPENYSSMSFRRGMVHQAIDEGRKPGDIIAKTGHRTLGGLQSYARPSWMNIYPVNQSVRHAIRWAAPSRQKRQLDLFE